jgi:hypothetical protein
MSAEETHEVEPVPVGFATDVLLAAHALSDQPTLALTSVSLACFVVLVPLTDNKAERWRFIAMAALLIFQVGWCGSERIFFFRQFVGKSVRLGELVHLTKAFVGRFLALGLLVLAAVGIPLVGAAVLLGASPKQPPYRLAMAGSSVVVDFALTFVTPALALSTRSVREALRIGLAMLRRTWPRCTLYVLCPPLALQAHSVAYPATLPMVQLIAVAGLTIVSLLAKGATVAFYLREMPVHRQDGAASL